MHSGADAVPTADHSFGPRSFDHDTRCGRSFGPLDQAEWQISTRTITLMCGEERPGLGREPSSVRLNREWRLRLLLESSSRSATDPEADLKRLPGFRPDKQSMHSLVRLHC